ncbi:MAG: aminotransferase class IV [Chitinophagaceae bacterium]|nr:aminotransferase class IV [Chitinophagaceae bacterium]
MHKNTRILLVSQNLFVNVNGLLQRCSETLISSANDDVRMSYGIYETILVTNGALKLATLHWQRLWDGLCTLQFSIPSFWNESFFTQQIIDLVTKNGLSKMARVRLQVYAENADAPFVPKYYIEATSLSDEVMHWNKMGLNIGVLENFKKPVCLESNCKISHSPHTKMAKSIMNSHNWDDVLLKNTNGNIIETAIANVFWIKDNTFFTPPISDGCLVGTMRAWFLLQMKELGISCYERCLTKCELLEADELFTTNSIRFIRWVQYFEEKVYTNEQTFKLYQLLAKRF